MKDGEDTMIHKITEVAVYMIEKMPDKEDARARQRRYQIERIPERKDIS